MVPEGHCDVASRPAMIRAMEYLIVGGAVFAGVAFVVSLAAMLVLRYRGRRVPAWLARLTVVAMGLQSGLLAIIFIRQPILLGMLALQLAVEAGFIWRAGWRKATALLLLAAGLPGALWWGFFLAQDALDPADLYLPDLWLWWAPSAAVALVGAGMLRMSDRAVQKPIFPQPVTLQRDPLALATAMSREASIGPFPVAGVIADGVALVVIGVGIALWGGLVAWPLAWLGAAAVYTVIGTELFYFVLSPRLRRAWEGFAAIGNPEMKRWRAVTGTQVPNSLPAMRKWLRDNPDRPESRWARAELQATLGDLAEARESALAMPLSADADRYEQRALLAWFGWLDGGELDFDSLQAEAESIGEPESRERLDARGRVLLARARDQAVRGGDWIGSLEELRALHGEDAAPLLREDLRRARYRAEAPVALVVAGAIMLLSGLAG